MMTLFNGIAKVFTATRHHDLARDHLARSMFRFGKVQLITRITGKPLLVPYVGDIKLLVKAGLTGANGNHYWGLHEAPDMAFTLHYLRSTDLFVDAGANVGSYTLLAAGAVGARTIAFEPVPETVSRLVANLQANSITERVDVRPVCLGSHKDTVRFTTDADTVNHVAKAGEIGIEVPMRRLDDEVTQQPALIKIDAEGFDEEVLAGSERLFSGTGPMALLIEMVSEMMDEKLRSRDFHLCSYHPLTRHISLGQRGRHNSLYIRDLAHATNRVRTASKFDLHGFGTL